MRTQPTTSQVLKWTQALRSGEYKQGKNVLQSERGHCCIGVGCEIFIPKNKQKRDAKGYLIGALPYSGNQPFAPRWLMEIDAQFGHITRKDLSVLNDKGYSFHEIADLLELVYVHKMLE